MKRFTVCQQIGGAFAILGLLGVVQATVTIGMLRTAMSQVERVPSQYLPLRDASEEFERRVLNARIHFIYYVTIQKPGAKENGWKQFELARKALPKVQDAASRIPGNQASEEALRVRGAFEAYEPALRKILDTVDRNENHGPQFQAQITEWARLGGIMVDGAGKLSKYAADLTSSASSDAMSVTRTVTNVTVAACAAALMLELLLAIAVSRRLSRRLRGVATRLISGADELAGAAHQIASSSQALAQGATEQAASVEQTSAETETISSSAARNQKDTSSVVELADETMQQVESANGALEKSVTAMKDISDSMSAIAKIIGLVDEIAFQTNILALNAAVEAARAGDAGMGFAVVADAVRTLAQRSAAAAKDTSELVSTTTARTSTGRQCLEETALVVRRILDRVGSVKAAAASVNHSSSAQGEGLSKMAGQLCQIGEVTRRVAASAEEGAAASEEMSAQAETIRQGATELMALIDRQASLSNF